MQPSNESKPMERTSGWNTVVLRVAPPLIGILVGAAGMNLAAVQSMHDKVSNTAINLDHLTVDLSAERKLREDQDRDTRQQISDARLEFLKAMDRMSSRLDSLIVQNTELIQLIKIQQQMVKP